MFRLLLEPFKGTPKIMCYIIDLVKHVINSRQDDLDGLFFKFNVSQADAAGLVRHGAWKGQPERHIVMWLLEKDSNMERKTIFLGNALSTAAHEGLEDMVELLLEKGADILENMAMLYMLPHAWAT